MNKLNILKKGLTFLIVLSLFTVIFQNSNVVSSNGSDHSLDINMNFEMVETSINQGSYENVDSIDIELPSSTWNIEDMELNFTNINDLGIEIDIIENKSYSGIYHRIYYQNINIKQQGLAVQIHLNESETLYGVYLYGRRESTPTPKAIQVQIRGYNTINNTPNNTIYLTMDINMSTVEGWYLQDFLSDSPLLLPKGDYFLVLNGSNIMTVSDNEYFWYYNDIDPKDTSLLISRFIETETWTTGISNSPFLYKIIRETEIPVYPENINMTIKIDTKYYEILNGPVIGSGKLPITMLDFSPNNEQINLPMFYNSTGSLIFDVNYTMNTHNFFFSPALVKINVNSTNEWTLTPPITRYSNNCSVKFYYPSKWENFTVFKDTNDITINVTIKPLENLLWITNDLISDGSEWEIKAYSPKINFNINTVKTEFEVGQELTFSTETMNGNYTFKLIDPLGAEKYSFNKTVPPDNTIFTYNIPSGILEGDYTAYIYWNNQTDAGVQSQVFTIISIPVSTSSNPDFLIYIIIAIIIVAAAFIGFFGYTRLRKVETKGKKKLKLVLEEYSDVMNLKYIIVLDKKSGIDIYAESFEEKEFDLTLIAGYLQALHNFGTEVLKGNKDSRTIKLEYRGSILLMSEFVNLRIIIIMKDNPSKNFLYAIESLAYDVYKNYGDLIDRFSGNLEPFRGVKKLVEKHLKISFLYPLEIIIPKKADLTQNEKEMIKRALDFMKQQKFHYFYAIYLLPENVYDPKDYEAILSLMEKGIFSPIEEN